MKTDELREKYLEFFVSKGHTEKPSDVLVPTWDPSVLFTPAGMNQFKDHFLGKVALDFTRATTCQKCLRTGDIDNVGRTAYHHTFFEMLGNFSFGDYFKRDAIHWAWEFLTSKKWLGIEPGKLHVTVYLDDDEAADIWHNEIKLPLSRISRLDESENFWPASAPSQGPDGVCGPCSEIYVDTGMGKPVEIWNLVFTQFNRVGDPPNNLSPLPSKNIDTGMGLERCASVLQGVSTNYHIDILRPIVEQAAEICGMKYDPEQDSGRRFRRMADHVRACAFSIHEHTVPGTKRAKYVIRRLLRRAVLDGRQLGQREPFLYKLVPIVAEMMKTPYPELQETVQRVASTIRAEEEGFFSTIDAGLSRIDRVFSDMKTQNRTAVSGEEGYDLYTTFGLPPELVENMAGDQGATFDWTGFRKKMDEHGEISGVIAETVFQTGPMETLKETLKRSEFLGYTLAESPAVVKGIVAILDGQTKLCDALGATQTSDPVKLVLDKSPFYGESGGQVGDVGVITGPGFRFEVTDTQKEGELIVHLGKLAEGKVTVGATCTARVKTDRRQAIKRAHSATHILHYALQKNLGKHAQQQGSKVEADALRFDFSNPEAIKPEALSAIETDVAAQVKAAAPIGWKTVSLADARAAGAMMLFGEKYPDPVRMVSMGEFSKELCGGIHLDNTREVEDFEIVSEELVAAGTRRIVALTGMKARENQSKTRLSLNSLAAQLNTTLENTPSAVRVLVEYVRALKKQVGGGPTAVREVLPKSPNGKALGEDDYSGARQLLRDAARLLNVAPLDAPQRVEALLADVESLQAQVATLAKAGDLSADSLIENAAVIGETKVIVAEAPGANANLLRQLVDQIRKKTPSAAVFLAAAQPDDKVMLLAGLSRDLTDKGHSAGNWVRDVAPVVGGGGGGKPDLAQAGGKDASKLPQALETAKQVIEKMLGA